MMSIGEYLDKLNEHVQAAIKIKDDLVNKNNELLAKLADAENKIGILDPENEKKFQDLLHSLEQLVK